MTKEVTTTEAQLQRLLVRGLGLLAAVCVNWGSEAPPDVIIDEAYGYATWLLSVFES